MIKLSFQYHEGREGAKVKLCSFLTLVLGGGVWLTTHSSILPWRKIPGTHWATGKVGPTAHLDDLEKRQVHCSCQDLNSRLSRP